MLLGDFKHQQILSVYKEIDSPYTYMYKVFRLDQFVFQLQLH